MPGVDDLNVFICAPGHSGTTLLDLLLGTHSEACSLGEIIHLPKNIALNTRCMCGVPVKSCGWWGQVLDILADSLGVKLRDSPYARAFGLPKATVIVDHRSQTPGYLFKRQLFRSLDLLRLRYGADWLSPALRSVDRTYEHSRLLYGAVRQVSGARVIVDSSKDYLRAIGMYRHAPWSTRIVLLSRDGRGVLYSNIRRGFSRRPSVAGWRNFYRRVFPLLDINVASQHVLHVRYEALVSDPIATLGEICVFLGMKWQPEMLDYKTKAHHITNGNDMRFQREAVIRPDTAWRDKLEVADLAYFNRLAGAINRRLGY